MIFYAMQPKNISNPLATVDNFNETHYLLANPDVAAAVETGQFKSGFHHFMVHGKNENRHLKTTVMLDKSKKLQNIKQLLRDDMPMHETNDYFDFLTPDLRMQFNIIDTTSISSNNYDLDVLSLIKKHLTGWILYCGAGSRNVYYENVINFEIAAYPSTDVLGVGEVLPFKDNSFDAVISIAVLEHVKDPWLCAKEIIRVLKPGGDLICCVPFLQPMHGYPHHYYNMSELGLKNLFSSGVEIYRHEVPASVLPIWSLTWILNSWAARLTEVTKNEFMNLKISDIMKNPESYLQRNFVTELSKEKNMALASATVIHGKKYNIELS